MSAGRGVTGRALPILGVTHRGYDGGVNEMIRTDSRGRVTLAGHPDSTYLLHEEPGGVLVLQPAVIMSAAQASYLALPAAARARIEEFVGDPSTAVKRTYKRHR